MNVQFGGKVVIVTGAASGVCRVILTRFVQAGAKGVLVDWDAEWGEMVARQLTAAGGEVLFVKTDVRDGRQVDAMVEQTLARFGRIDILVHGAGVTIRNKVVDLADEEWDLQINVQLRGAFLLSRAVARTLIAQNQGGRLILIGSGSATNARVGAAPHAASKAAEAQLMRCLALELGPHNITANMVSPGLTDISGISRTVQNPEYQKAHLAQRPLGRLAKPDDTADAVLFIASEYAGYITGHNLPVDGGYGAGKMLSQGPRSITPDYKDRM